MKTTNISKLAGMTLALAITATSQGANLAFDNASAYAYDDGWQTGDNGGYGWGPWTLQSTGFAGFFVATSTSNGNGVDDGFIGGLPGDDDIDTQVGPNPDNSAGFGDPVPNTTIARSLGMFSDNTSGPSRADAFRSFTGGPLTVGQTFTIAFDNGDMIPGPGATIGIGLLNAGGDTLWQLTYSATGSGFYRYTDGSIFPNDTSVEFGTEGLSLAVELLAPDMFRMDLMRLDGMFDSVTGFLIPNVDMDMDIAQIHVFSDRAGSDPSSHFFINSMEVIPEPSSAMLVLAALALPLLRRRR